MKNYKKKKYENNAKRNKNLSDLRRDIEYQMKKKKQIIGVKSL